MSRVCKRCGGGGFYPHEGFARCVPCKRDCQLQCYAEHPTRRVINACQARLRKAHEELGLVPTRSAFNLLGFSKHGPLRHLEGRFKEGTTWRNYGTLWNVGRRVPISAFPLGAEGLALAASYKNVQPIRIAHRKATTRAEALRERGREKPDSVRDHPVRQLPATTPRPQCCPR